MKTILEHAHRLTQDRKSLGFDDTFPEMIEKLREELNELEEIFKIDDPGPEMADCILVLARMIELLNVDPEKVVEKKMHTLRRRYDLARKLSCSFKDQTSEQLYQMAKNLMDTAHLEVRFGSCENCIHFLRSPEDAPHLCTCLDRQGVPLAENSCSKYVPR